MIKNIKVGILNYHYSNNNYGAVLQACALEYVLTTNGIYSEHIRYIPQPAKQSVFTKIKSWGGDFLRHMGLKKMIIPHSKFKNPDVFEKARKEMLTRSQKEYHTYNELIAENFDYTHVIVGSDQVWRPSYTENSMMIYFLDFVKSNCKKISYAASFGTDSWEVDKESSETLKVSEALKSFSAVSVRERSGIAICNEVFTIEATHVLDPTLLAGKKYFDDIASRSQYDNEEERTIVYYKLDISEDFNLFMREIQKSKKIKTKNIYFTKINNKYYYYSVKDWLSKIKNSELVITDSFHCICFAILFNKDFIYYPNENNRGMSRIESLFEQLNIQNRIFYGDICINEYLKNLEKLNYHEINTKLELFRCESLRFLLSSIKERE